MCNNRYLTRESWKMVFSLLLLAIAPSPMKFLSWPNVNSGYELSCETPEVDISTPGIHLPTASEMATTSLQVFWRIWTFIFPLSLEDIDTKRPGGVFCWKWHTQIWYTLPYIIFVCSDMHELIIEDDAALKACADMCCVVLCRFFDFGFALIFAFVFFPCLCLFSVCVCL